MKKVKLLLTALAITSLIFALSIGAFAFTLGDVDTDGKITAADARLALRASVGLEKYDEASDEFKACDVDSDGKITAADARLILRCSVGLESFAHVHSYGEWTKEVNDKGLSTGRHYRKCSCGDTQYGSCEYGTPVEKSPATCTSSNTMQKSCIYCGATKTYGGSTPALGHKKQLVKSTAPTCTEKGSNVYTCTVCQKTIYEAVNALGHNFTSTDVKDETTLFKSATCTTDAEYYYTCSNANCGKSAKGIDETKTYVDTGSKLGHDYTVKNCVFGDKARGLICNRCNYIDNSAEGYNQLVNAIKSKDFIKIDVDTLKPIHSVSVISKSKMTSTCDNIDFGLLWTSTVKNLYAEEMTGDDISYLTCRRNRSIGTIVPYSNTKTTADTPVSSIEEGDATITVEKVSGLAANALLSDFGNMDDNGNCTNTITVGTTDYNIADFKTKAISGDLIKITAVAKKETFFGTNGVSKLDSSTKTALQKLTGYNIRLDADEFGDNYTLTQIDEEEDIYKMQMDMKLKDITSTATVVFYFDAETLNPVAARYDVNVIMAQDVAMSIEIFGSNGLSVSGTMDPVVDTVTSTVYLFSDFYG